jgi:hypothetical protein
MPNQHKPTHMCYLLLSQSNWQHSSSTTRQDHTSHSAPVENMPGWQEHCPHSAGKAYWHRVLWYWVCRLVLQSSSCYYLTSNHLSRLTKFREIWEGMGLQQTRQQGHSVESIRDAMIDLHQMYPKAGIWEVISLLFHERDISVSRSCTS